MKPVSVPSNAPSEARPGIWRRRIGRTLAGGLAALLIALLGLVLFAWMRQPRDPVCQGRRLSDWMEDLVGLDAGGREAATNAVRQLGTDAVPALIRHLGTPNSSFGRTATDAQKYLPRGLWFWAMKLTRPRAGIERRWQAAAALALLGPDAAPALPALARAMLDADPQVSESAIEALRAIRPAGLVAIVGAMNTTSQTLFAHLCSAIGRCGPDAAMVATQLAQVVLEAPPFWHSHLHAALVAVGPPAVAPLAEFLRRDEAAERDLAVAALQGMTIEDYASVKAVIALLQAGDARVRRGAVKVLSGRTFWERRVVGALAQALGDPEATVRLEAIGALSAVGAWSDQVTNALPALRALAAAATGQERGAAAAALARLGVIQRPPGR